MPRTRNTKNTKRKNLSVIPKIAKDAQNKININIPEWCTKSSCLNIYLKCDLNTRLFLDNIQRNPDIVITSSDVESEGIYIFYKNDDPSKIDVHAHVYINTKQRTPYHGKLVFHLSGRCPDEQHIPPAEFDTETCPKQVGCHFKLKGTNLNFTWSGNRGNDLTANIKKKHHRNTALLENWVKNNIKNGYNSVDVLISYFENMLSVCNSFCDITNCEGEIEEPFWGQWPHEPKEEEPTTPSSQTPQLNPNASVFFMQTKGGRKSSKKTKKTKKTKKCGGKSSKKLKKTRKKSRKKTKSKHKK